MKQLTIAVVVLLLAQAQPSRLRSPAGVPEPIAVLNAERAWSGADAFWTHMSANPPNDDRAGVATPNETRQVRRFAVRAIGRVEDPGQVRRLLSLADVPGGTIADAVAQSLYGFDPSRDPELLSIVHRRMTDMTKADKPEDRMFATAALAQGMSRIRYVNAEQVSGIESLLAAAAEYATTSIKFLGPYVTTVSGLEALARVNTRVVKFDDETVALLGKAATGDTLHGSNDSGRLYGFMALVAARALEENVERKALKDADWAVRRAAVAVLAGAGGGLDEDARIAEIRAALDDVDPHVRYEAIRAWGRHGARAHGCQPLVDALKDTDPHVVLQATDLLGTLCLGDEEITKRLDAESETPMGAAWQPQTHAFVSLAKRSSEKAELRMEAFTTHPNWWVRMYSAFAAGGAKDLLRLDKLAYDANDNVREAALPHFNALDPGRAERAILAALERTDIQLVRTAAGLIKERTRSVGYVPPLVASLDRLTRLRSMTSRDARMALLDAVERHGRAEEASQLAPWLRDFDTVVALRAADVITGLSGKPVQASPTTPAHIPTQPFGDLRQCASINMSAGKPIRLTMNLAAAPIAVEQFLKLATIDRYYNGLTIHRVVPNFVIQGGSPGANEYAGNKDYWRDEIAASNVRGSVGLSIRGRNTGDAQFYINLIDNPRLDGGYTVFANVYPEDMEVVDRVQEGDVMRSIDKIPCSQLRR